ncbi:hypothetical protein ACFLV5_04850 [Chloroflexota bacterium]
MPAKIRAPTYEPKIPSHELPLTVTGNVKAMLREWRKAMKKWRKGQEVIPNFLREFKRTH